MFIVTDYAALILLLQMIYKENKNFRKMFIVADLVSLSKDRVKRLKVHCFGLVIKDVLL